jgi:predicted CopG family antitoxin
LFIVVHEFKLRFDVAALCNLDYKHDGQKKIVDKICEKLPSDMDWDETDTFEKAFKELGYKRYKLDKKLLGVDSEKESFSEQIQSSSSKDGKGMFRSVLDSEEPKIKIQNPAYVDLSTAAKTTKSASDAIAALIAQMKKLLPAVSILNNQEGHLHISNMFFTQCTLFHTFLIWFSSSICNLQRTRKNCYVPQMHQQLGPHS